MWGLGWQAVQAQEERAPPAAKSPPGLHAFETPELPIYQYPNHPLPTIFEAQRSALCAGAARGDKLPWPKLA
jgi:hypothetical protein